jgi:predicted TIM-barrel fold metal-dependent hydrolase
MVVILEDFALAVGAGGCFTAAEKLFEQLCDVGEKRIAEMDAARIDMQVSPLTSLGTEQVEAADAVALTVLERMVRKHGFKGAIINGHHRGRYLDDKVFWPILECAEALNVAIYLHPTLPPKPVIEASYGGFSPIVTEVLASPGWGWHIETAVHVIRLVVGGVFDQYANLQIVIGHIGEALPFMLQRLDVIPMALTKLTVR